jgi:hypothetical protein
VAREAGFVGEELIAELRVIAMGVEHGVGQVRLIQIASVTGSASHR